MLVTQQTAGYNGILWDLMGYRWESAEICGFFMPFSGLEWPSRWQFRPVDKSVTPRIAFESMLKA
jgi:hypothetical protein